MLHACPGLPAQDTRALKEAVWGALEGHPVDEWETRFADMVIDRRSEPFVKPFYDRSRYRAAAIGLIAKTCLLPVLSTATSRPREVSIATGIGAS